MFTAIESYLQEHVPIELYAEIQRSFTTFELYEYTAYKLVLENVINQESFVDASVLPLLLRNSIIDCLNEILLDLEISVNDPEDLTVRNDILITLDTLQLLEDYTYVSNLVVMGNDSVTTLSDILEYVSVNTSTYYLDKIDRVSNKLIERIYSLIVNDKDDTMNIDPEIITRFKHFESVINYKLTIGGVMVRSGVKPGLPLPYYLRQVQPHLDKGENMALDVLSVILLTTEGSKNPLLVFKENQDVLESYTGDISGAVLELVGKL